MPIYFRRYNTQSYKTRACSKTGAFNALFTAAAILLGILTCGTVTNFMLISPMAPYDNKIMSAEQIGATTAPTIN